MNTYRKARAAGGQLTAALTRTGIDPAMAVVVPALSAAGAPVVHVTLTAAGAGLARARELSAVGAWVSVFGGEHDLDARLVRVARLRPGSPRPTAWERVAEFPPDQGSAQRRG